MRKGEKMAFNPEMAATYGGHRRQAVLDTQKIIEVYKRYHKQGDTTCLLAEEFDVSRKTIYRIVNAKAFVDITEGVLDETSPREKRDCF